MNNYEDGQEEVRYFALRWLEWHIRMQNIYATVLYCLCKSKELVRNKMREKNKDALSMLDKKIIDACGWYEQKERRDAAVD